MPPYIDQSSEDFQYRLHVENLPVDVTQKLIHDQFSRYGTIGRLYLKRRVTRESSILLPNPHVIIFYVDHHSIDAVMASRPLFMKDRELRIRRCLPMIRRYPYESNLTTNKMLVRASGDCEDQEQILPNDEIILDYLKATGGTVVRWERFDERTLFVEFNDYDPVDICCLSRPHFINDQMIEIEKCGDEQQARRRAQYQQKNRSSSLRVSSTKTSNDTISLTLTLNTSEQTIPLASTDENMTQHIEYEHKQMILELKNQLEKTMKKRIRLQRLTTDCQNEQKRLTADFRRWQKLYGESIQEKPRVQEDGERKLAELKQEYSRIQQLYDQL